MYLLEFLRCLLIDRDMDDDGENIHPVQDTDTVQPDVQEGVDILWGEGEIGQTHGPQVLGEVKGALCVGCSGPQIEWMGKGDGESDPLCTRVLVTHNLKCFQPFDFPWGKSRAASLWE
jgi:hypothetical protein